MVWGPEVHLPLVTMAFRGAGRWSRWSGRQLRVAGAAACVVAAVLQTRLWAHGVSEGEDCARGSALLGQLLWVTPASWLQAPKRRRRGRRPSLSSALEERGRERRRRDNRLGKWRALSPAARGNCCPRAVTPALAAGSECGKAEETGWRSLAPPPPPSGCCALFLEPF